MYFLLLVHRNLGIQDHLEHGYMYAAFVFVLSCVRTPRDGLIKEPNKFLH